MRRRVVRLDIAHDTEWAAHEVLITIREAFGRAFGSGEVDIKLVYDSDCDENYQKVLEVLS